MKEKLRLMFKKNTKIYFTLIDCEDVVWIHLPRKEIQCLLDVKMEMNFRTV
jgi:hypothetical protein